MPIPTNNIPWGYQTLQNIKTPKAPNPKLNPHQRTHHVMNSIDNIVNQVLCSYNIINLTNLAETSAATADEVCQNLQQRMNALATPFFPNATVLQDILRTCDAVISGSSALHFILPITTTVWKPKDLDLYVPHRYMKALTTRLENLGYHKLPRNDILANTAYLSSSQILAVHKFILDENVIDVVESCTDAACSPIFQFHSTAVMNFVGADTIFSAYPNLTMQYKSLLNPYSIYKHAYDRTKISHLEKYRTRGFTFIPCRDSHASRFECRSNGRTITDNGCLWIDLHTGLRKIQHPADIFRKFGILDVEWRLGGHVCESDCFLHPRIRVIEDKS